MISVTSPLNRSLISNKRSRKSAMDAMSVSEKPAAARDKSQEIIGGLAHLNKSISDAPSIGLTEQTFEKNMGRGLGDTFSSSQGY